MADGGDVDEAHEFDFHQKIILNGEGNAHTVHGFEVKIYASELSTGEVISASSKVRISTITNQNWDSPTHHGKIVASNSQYLSYVLEGRNGYVLRLIEQETNSRALLKGFVGAIVDVAFCHVNSNLLSCMDQGGNLYLWDLDKSKDEPQIQIDAALRLVIHRSSIPDNVEHRLVWSPHVPLPEEEEDEQEICSVVLTHGSDIEVLDIHQLFSTYGHGMKVPREQLHCGCCSIPGAHEKSICDMCLSPDGSVLATVSEDGHLKFWQVTWERDQSEPPKCLHDFVPHDGAPVTRLLFCDNHLSQDPGNQYWRFLITAANNNTDVKIWCAVSWKCLQTLKFFPPMDSRIKDVDPHILLGLDLSASYLVVTDSRRKAVLILQVFTSPAVGDASVTSVTEYLLTQPILNFMVGRSAPVPDNSDEFSGEDSGEEEEFGKYVPDFDSRRNVVLLQLHCIHTKSMQELMVKFEPPDIFGVPPIKQLKTLSSLEAGGNTLALEQDLEYTSTFITPAEILPTSSRVEKTLPSLSIDPLQLPPLNNFNASPKLLTPSEFTSPTKSEIGLSHPLLSPASILAAVTVDQQSPDSTASVSHTKATPHHVSSGLASTPQSLSDMQDTLTFVSSNFENLASGSILPCDDDSDANISVVDGVSIGSESCAIEGNEDIASRIDDCTLRAEHVPLPTETSSEDEPSAEETKKTFESILEFLDGDKSEMSNLRKPTEPNQSSFEEFAELLTNPENLQEQEKGLQDADQLFVLEEAPTNCTPAVASSVSHSASSFPDVLKSTSDQDPPLYGLHEDKSVIELDGMSMDTQWPDIGAPELSRDKAGISLSENCDLAEAIPVEGAVSNELFQVDSQAGLRMPSALTDTHLEQDDVMEMSAAHGPDLLDQELSLEAMLSLEAEEGASKVKSRSRKRYKKGKKQSANALASFGVTEVLEAPNYSDGDTVQVISAVVDLLPSVVSDPVMKEPIADTLSQLVKLVSDQHKLLCEMKSDQQRILSAMQDQMEQFRLSVMEEQRACISEMRIDQQQKLDRILKDKQTLDKQKQDKLITTLSNTLTTAVHVKLDKLIKTEMKNSILPVLQNYVASLRGELSDAITNQLSTTDGAVRDGINRFIGSKELPDAIVSAMTSLLQQTLPSMCEEVFKTSVVSSFEKSCQEMFRQIDESFRRGTMEYVSQLRQQQQEHEVQDSTLHYLFSSVENLRSVVGKSLETSAPGQLQALVHQQVTTLSHQMKDVLTKALVETVRKEMQASKVSQDSQHREEVKGQIQKLILSQSYNSAFELALSTSDLQLVTYLCQQVDPDVVFYKSPSLLSQPVLLSLIQQLSVNLEENLELKLKYLDQSLLALDVDSDITKNHMLPVIKQLSQQIASLLQKIQAGTSVPNPAIVVAVKRLLMVSKQMCSY